MNGENLAYDYRFNVVDSPTDWAFNWDYAECGTSKPTPRPHHATMWLSMNDDDPLMALKNLFRQFSKKGKLPIVLKVNEAAEFSYLFRVIHKSTKATLFEGEMEKPDEDGGMNDPNVGHFALFSSYTKTGTEMMKYIADHSSFGHFAYVPHETTVLMKTADDNDNTYEVMAITGEGPDSTDGNDFERERSRDSIGTRFNLLKNQQEVARCYMSYRDGSHDPSIGPTLEMIAVHQDHRGKGLAKLLWYWVLRYIERNFTLECLNNDAPIGYIMVKATQVGTQEIEIRKRKKNGKMVPVGFKEFVFDFCGFSVRAQKGVIAYMCTSRRPIDEEAVLYIPLLSREALKAKFASDTEKAPKPGDALLRAKNGKRMCMWCRNIALDLVRCSQCEVAFYCNRNCQKQDWKRHKKWCSKTREEVKERLIKEGGMEELSDGTHSLNLS